MGNDVDIIKSMGDFYTSKRNGETYSEIVEKLQKSIVDLSQKNKMFNVYLKVIESGNTFLVKEMSKYFRENGIYFSAEQYDEIYSTLKQTSIKFTALYLNRDLLKLPEDFKPCVRMKIRSKSRLNSLFLRRFNRADVPYELMPRTYNSDEKKRIIDLMAIKHEISGTPPSIKWNAKQSNSILQIAENNLKINLGEFGKGDSGRVSFDRKLTYFPEGLDWTKDRIDRALDIIKKSEIQYVEGFDSTDTEDAIVYTEKAIRKEVFPTGVEYTPEQRRKILEIVREKKNLELLPTGLDWTSDEKNVILDIAEECGTFFGLPEDIEWSSEFNDRIMNIAKKNNSIVGFPQKISLYPVQKYEVLRIASDTGNMYSLPQKESWDNGPQKAYILEMLFKAKGVVRFPENITWEPEEKKMIIDFVSQNAALNLFGPIQKNSDQVITEYNLRNDNSKDKYAYVSYVELPQNLELREDEVDRLIEIFRVSKNYKILPTNVSYTPEQIRNLMMIILSDYSNKIFVDVNDPEKKEILTKIFEQCKEKDEAFQEIFDGIVKGDKNLEDRLKHFDPITCVDLTNGLDFDFAPAFNNRSVDELTIQDYEYEKSLLLQIYDRLKLLGVIDSGINIDEKKFGSFGDVNQRRINKRLENLEITNPEDQVQVSTNLAFWINKLTKYINIQMYTRVLDNSKFYDTDNEILKKNIKKDANELVNAIRYLHGGDPSLQIDDGINPERTSSFAYMKKVYKLDGTFSDFIQNELRATYERTGNLKLDETGCMREFKKSFNKVLWELKGRSWSEKEIIDAFEYTGKSLDIMEQLYDVKDTLLTHFMELSTKEEYKDRIVVRKKKDERAETSYDDVLYVFAKGIARPLTFHCKLDGKEVADKVELIFDRPFYAKRIEEITGRSLEDLMTSTLDVYEKEFTEESNDSAWENTKKGIYNDFIRKRRSKIIDHLISKGIVSDENIIKALTELKEEKVTQEALVEFTEDKENGINVIFPVKDADREAFILRNNLIQVISKLKSNGKEKRRGEYGRLFNINDSRNGINTGRYFNLSNLATMNSFIKDVLSVEGDITESLDGIEFIKKGSGENEYIVDEKWEKVLDEKIAGVDYRRRIEGVKVPEYNSVLNLAKVLFDRARFKYEGVNFTDLPDTVKISDEMQIIENSKVNELSSSEEAKRCVLNPFVLGLEHVKKFIHYEEPDWEKLAEKKKSSDEVIAEKDEIIAAKDEEIERIKQEARQREEELKAIIATKDKTIEKQGQLIGWMRESFDKFVNKVRNHPIGRFLFRKQLTALNSAKENDSDEKRDDEETR